MTVLNADETLALAKADYAIAYARWPELAVLALVNPDIHRIWMHGWLSGRDQAFKESARMLEERSA
jgi:hypothetical protein